MYNPNLPGNPKIIYGDHTTLPAANFPNILCDDTVDHERYISNGTEWIEIGGSLEFVKLANISIPTNPDGYYPEKILCAAYNGREILFGGCYLTEETGGEERPCLVRYRDGVMTSLRDIIPGPDTRTIYHAIEWDGSKWWVAGRLSGSGGDAPLFTIDENDNVEDLSALMAGNRSMKALKTDGITMLVGGATLEGQSIKLFKIVGKTITDITALLQGAVGAKSITAIDYRDGVWLIGAEGASTGYKAFLNSWDGTTFTDLSSNLPGTSVKPRRRFEAISHNDEYWLIGLGIYPSLVKYDGLTWTTYEALDQFGVQSSATLIKKITYLGEVFVFIFGTDVAVFDGSNIKLITTNFDGVIAKRSPSLGGGTFWNIGSPCMAVYGFGEYHIYPVNNDEITTVCKRVGEESQSPWIYNGSGRPIKCDSIRSKVGLINSLKISKKVILPTITGAGAPLWTGEPGEEYTNDTDGKKYWWANGGWRSAGP